MTEEGVSYATVATSTLGGDVGQRLQQLVAGWRGAERGQPVTVLHQECTSAAGATTHGLLPAHLLSVPYLDATTLRTALARVNNTGSHSALAFRVVPAGHFDAALVPIGRAGEMPDRWVLAIDVDLALQDQVALYAHALGHLLLNRETTQMGRMPPLDPRDGYAHADMLGELRQIESTRSALDRRVVEAYPLLADLLQTHEQLAGPGLISSDLKERLGEAGWRGYLVTSPYEFTTGRIYIRGSAIRRGPKLRADALLRAEASVPIALVNTLRPGETYTDAEQRLIEYAHERLRVPFAYLLEDSAVHELDWSTAIGSEPIRTTLVTLPTRDQLWARWTGALGLTDEQALNALRYPYQLGSGRMPRYYQDAAINRAIVAILQAQRELRPPRILLTMATGTSGTDDGWPIAAAATAQVRSSSSS